jgi:hAT family C-terminal dimerisation region
MFLDPVSGIYERIPVGLKLTDSKKSVELSEQILEILNTCGVKQENLYTTANDTTNSSVKVGFLLTGEKGTCTMPTTSLLIGHATGILQRSSAGQVSDSFVRLQELFKEVLDAAGWLNNKKAKGRYLRYARLMNQLGRKARKLVMPNSTRVAGIATEPEQSLLVDFECTAKNVLKLAIEKLWGVGINKFRDPHNNPTEDSSDNNEDTMMMDPLEKMRKRNRRQRGPSNANTEDDPVSTCIDDFFSQKFQIHQVMSGQQNINVPQVIETIGSTNYQWLANLEFIMKNFDLIEWWRNTGKSQYPMIYPVAMYILSLPDSNRHQERTFSAAAWMDGKLNSMQKDLTFQMKVLMYKTEDFLERYVDTMEPKQLETAARKSKERLMKHVGSKKEEEIEQDTEYLIEMYGITGDE